ncbi:hypothetical protein Hsar01_01004 [Haloferula sargassicola]|uniref:Beta-agarase/YXIM esterase-like galactose-binding domain-containing protein n=1 Tax=Haloferula sargassicola TaxID=490096 RepID=A0ABP9UJJ8_9BACT
MQRNVSLFVAALLLGVAAPGWGQDEWHFDFGNAGTAAGFVAVTHTTAYSAARKYGWTETSGLNLRDRGTSDDLRRDFIFTNSVSGRTFRVSGLTSGKYLLRVLCGDASYGDHVVTVAVSGAGTLPTLSPKTAQYLELSATVESTGTLDITFGSPTPNWVVNGLSIEPTEEDLAPVIQSSPASEWDASVFATDPTPALLDSFESQADGFEATGLSRAGYLGLIAGEVDFWKSKQDASGAIIDPYADAEIQYSTPAFANAAAVLVVNAGRADLLEPACKAMDWATLRLHNRQAAGSHEDFYPTMLAHAYRLLEPRADAARVAAWRANLTYDPYSIYRQAMGSMNWNIVSSCGEALFQMMGLRPATNAYVTESWAAQGRHFTSPYGLYMEGPMAYDHFPRIFLADVIARGYDGPFSTEVSEAMDRAAVTSLFMQSPSGELPAGGRSAHHQWNEAEQALTYEIYAAKSKAAGNTTLAGVYKRAAHLALSSMQRWVRPSGEMQIVKNWVDPASRHGYEGYSYHSQYNLLPMAMLASAYEYAGTTEDVAEGPAPADVGGFMFRIKGLNKVFANAGGTYVELDTTADHHYDATGLIRVHQKGISPQLGPSDSLLASSSYTSPAPAPITTGVGVSWQDGEGKWRTLGEMGGSEITSVAVTPGSQSPDEVAFDVTYAGSLPNVAGITEHYRVTPAGVQLTTEVTGYSGPLRYVWPVLSNDGRTASVIALEGKTVSVSQGGPRVIFTAAGADSVRVEADAYSNHNGWARLGVAEFPAGGAITLSISQAEAATSRLFWKGDADGAWADPGNWSADAGGSMAAGRVPEAATSVVFSASGARNEAATVLDADLSVRGLRVTSSGNVGIGGSGDLTLGADGLGLAAGAGEVAISTTGAVVLGGPQTWTNDSSHAVVLDSSVDSFAGDLLGLAGPGVFSFSKSIAAGLQVGAGTTLRIGGAGFGSASPIIRLDDFDSYAAGPSTTASEGVWSAEFVDTANSNIVASDRGLSLETKGGAAWRGAETDLAANWGAGIEVGETATVFFQFKATSTGGAFDVMFGLSPDVSDIDSNNAWQDFAVMPFLAGAGDGSADFQLADAGLPGNAVIQDVHLGEWYNIWLVIDNAAETYSVYYSQGENDGIFGGTAAHYRNGFTGAALHAFGVMAAGGAGSTVLIDQVHFLRGADTTYPVGANPPPQASPTSLLVEGDVTLDAGSTIEFDVAGGSLHDRLASTGQLVMQGALKVSLDASAAAPVAGDVYELFDAITLTVTPSDLDLPDLGPGLAWDTSGIAFGRLRVIGAVGYAAWSAGYPFPSGNDDPEADPDMDGIANAFEWLFGSDPLVADSQPLPDGTLRKVAGSEFVSADPTKDYLSLAATVRKETPGMTVSAQSATSLAGLDDPASSDSIVSLQLADLGEFERREWIRTVPVDAASHAFMRLKMTAE